MECTVEDNTPSMTIFVEPIFYRYCKLGVGEVGWIDGNFKEQVGWAGWLPEEGGRPDERVE